MRRSELAAEIARQLDPSAHVICSLGTAGRSWRDVASGHATYVAGDPMGLAPAMALGYALAQPARSVLLLEGDGDLLMNAGVLVTIAGAATANLRVIVFRNDRYETGGGRPLAGSDALSIAGLAAASGWTHAGELSRDATTDEMATAVAALLAAGGPALLSVPVVAEPSPYGGPGRHSGAEARTLFQQRTGLELS